ncbi:MAG: hypothetical protein LKJ84_01430 [Bacilli bacterium]|jgi:hypothetical protein|nr:hypothetical protein [Bacilli bacterium]
MNNENNTNQTNEQNVVSNINVVNDTSTIPVVNDTQQEQTTQQAPQPQATNNSTSAKSTPKVVKVEHIKEVVKEVKPKDDNSNKSKVKDQPNDGTPQKEVVVKEKGGFFGRFILFLFIIFLFAFVYYLPEISQYIEDYKKAKSGIEDGSMKSGTMTCTLTKDNKDNLSTIYETTFTYTKNKLKKTEQVTSYKLKDDATSTAILDESENECQELKSALTGVSGIDVSCSKTAVLQKTTQVIDYTKFNAEEVTTNIAEYKGFYPEFQLDQSVAGIRKNLEDAGYSCQTRDYQ